MTDKVKLPPMKQFDFMGSTVKKTVKQRKYIIFGEYQDVQKEFPAPDGKINYIEFRSALSHMSLNSRYVFGKNPKYVTYEDKVKLYELINNYTITKTIDSEDNFQKELLEALDYLQANMK